MQAASSPAVRTSFLRRFWVISLLVGIAAGIIDLGRLWLGNHDALTQVIWAEDGLFPLCVDKASFITCLTDPFAGYLLVLPRLLAGAVAPLPAEQWALATNVLGALLAGLTAAFAYLVMRRFGAGQLVSVLIGLLPVIAPITGLEALGALGSSYMLLLYLGTLIVCFPPASRYAGWAPLVGIGVFLLLTSLTIPLAAVLAVLLLVQGMRARIAWRSILVWWLAIGLGLLAQALTAAHASKPREISVGTDTVSSWVSSVPSSILTFWPGLNLGDYKLYGVFPITYTGITAAAVVVGLGVIGLVAIVRGGDRRVGAGLMVLSGLAFGAVPSIIGWANNRYFVVPCLLWAAALLVVLDGRLARIRTWKLVAVGVVILAIWWPLIPASWFRTTPAPAWQSEVARVKASCRPDPAKQERIIFSPYWPPNWGDGLSEPSHPNLPCTVVWRWGL